MQEAAWGNDTHIVGINPDEKVKLLTLHEDGGVGVQRLSKHNILRLKTQQRTTQGQSCDMLTSSSLLFGATSGHTTCHQRPGHIQTRSKRGF